MIKPIFITVIVRKSDFDRCHLQDSLGLKDIGSEIRSGFSTDGEIVAHYCMSPMAAKLFCEKFAKHFGCEPDDKNHVAIYELFGGGFLWDCDWIEQVDDFNDESWGLQLKS